MLLGSMGCELLSPCMTAKNTDRVICARPATIENADGIWIRLELKHSMQSLLDSCGNGKLTWLKVAVRLDLANTLKVNPAHLKIISLEQRDDGLVILQVLLTQPPDSALSLANVGDKLHKQAQHYLLRAEQQQQGQDAEAYKNRQPAADTTVNTQPVKLSRSTDSGISVAETEGTTSIASDADDLVGARPDVISA